MRHLMETRSNRKWWGEGEGAVFERKVFVQSCFDDIQKRKRGFRIVMTMMMD